MEGKSSADFLRMNQFAPWVIGMTLVASSAGCAALVVGAAGGAAGAVYVMGKLTEEVNYDVPAVHEAAVAGVKDLQLTLSEDRADKLSAHLESEFADRAHVWIDLESIADSRTRMTIRVGLTGDEIRSRKILETTKQHLPRPGSPSSLSS
jgi:hypothetical protein